MHAIRPRTMSGYSSWPSGD